MDFKSLGVSYGVQADRERTETRSLVERFQRHQSLVQTLSIPVNKNAPPTE